MNQHSPFKWRHFESEIILLCVRWYLRVILQHIVAKLSAICFTKRAARHASQRGFELKWEVSHHLDWLVKSVHTKALPPSPIF